MRLKVFQDELDKLRDIKNLEIFDKYLKCKIRERKKKMEKYLMMP